MAGKKQPAPPMATDTTMHPTSASTLTAENGINHAIPITANNQNLRHMIISDVGHLNDAALVRRPTAALSRHQNMTTVPKGASGAVEITFRRMIPFDSKHAARKHPYDSSRYVTLLPKPTHDSSKCHSTMSPHGQGIIASTSAGPKLPGKTGLSHKTGKLVVEAGKEKRARSSDSGTMRPCDSQNELLQALPPTGYDSCNRGLTMPSLHNGVSQPMVLGCHSDTINGATTETETTASHGQDTRGIFSPGALQPCVNGVVNMDVAGTGAMTNKNLSESGLNILDVCLDDDCYVDDFLGHPLFADELLSLDNNISLLNSDSEINPAQPLIARACSGNMADVRGICEMPGDLFGPMADDNAAACSDMSLTKSDTSGHIPVSSSSVQRHFNPEHHRQDMETSEWRRTLDNQFNADLCPDICMAGDGKSQCNVIDVSPEFASTSGGDKIIIIVAALPASQNGYSCKFGSRKVDATQIQTGVLRCYAPSHPVGVVSLTILCDGQYLATCPKFTYFDSSSASSFKNPPDHTWLSLGTDELRSMLMQRLSALDALIEGNKARLNVELPSSKCEQLEDNLVEFCKELIKKSCQCSVTMGPTDDAMTILHLMAALGFTKLIQLLCSHLEGTHSELVSSEMELRRCDQFSWTPLQWACARGNFDTVCVLIQWDDSVVAVADRCGCTPLVIATQQGHVMVASYLEKFQQKKSSNLRSQDSNSPHLSLSRSSPDLHSSYRENGADGRRNRPASFNDDTQQYSTPKSSNTIDEGANDSPAVVGNTLGKTLVCVQAILQQAASDVNSDEDMPTEDTSRDDSFLMPGHRSWSASSSCGSESYLSSMTPPSLPSSSPFNPQSHDTAEFCEFFFNSGNVLDKDFAELTLTEEEQSDLYDAASIIQKAYKTYKQRKKQHNVELQAATLIQSYYRRYKQYATFKKMQRGAVVIQNQYRAHREKRKSHAASLIQCYYRNYRQRKLDVNVNDSDRGIQDRCRAQHMADRKANRFMHHANARSKGSDVCGTSPTIHH